MLISRLPVSLFGGVIHRLELYGDKRDAQAPLEACRPTQCSFSVQTADFVLKQNHHITPCIERLLFTVFRQLQPLFCTCASVNGCLCARVIITWGIRVPLWKSGSHLLDNHLASQTGFLSATCCVVMFHQLMILFNILTNISFFQISKL